jgi:hypothetical protein
MLIRFKIELKALFTDTADIQTNIKICDDCYLFKLSIEKDLTSYQSNYMLRELTSLFALAKAFHHK